MDQWIKRGTNQGRHWENHLEMAWIPNKEIIQTMRQSTGIMTGWDYDWMGLCFNLLTRRSEEEKRIKTILTSRKNICSTCIRLRSGTPW